MAEIIGSRLEERMVAAGLSQSQLARIVNLKQPSIGRLISGETRETGKLLEIAEAVNSTPEYLTGASDDAGPPEAGVSDHRRKLIDGQKGSPSPADLGLVAIKEVDLTLGMGGGYIGDGAVIEVQRYFPATWLRELTRTDPEHLVFARAKGDSMKPTLSDGDIVLIDLKKNAIREQDAVWAIAVAEIGMVKRIWANPDGSYKIKSDNPNVDAETAVDGEMFVMGQVVGKLGKL